LIPKICIKIIFFECSKFGGSKIQILKIVTLFAMVITATITPTVFYFLAWNMLPALATTVAARHMPIRLSR
jgi:hypothetical protein